MKELKGLRIVSDGTVVGTRVYSKDGEDLTAKLYIRSIEWKHNAGGVPTCHITSMLTEIEYTGDAKYDERWLDTSTHGSEYRQYHEIEEIREREKTASRNDSA
jgi:hypothetical protein